VSRPVIRNPEKDPAYALGQTLRRLREAAGITTHAAAGARLGYGPDSIRKGETGAQVPTEVAIRKMLDVYQVPAIMRQTVLDMWKLARTSKGPIPEFVRMYIEREPGAEFIKISAPVLVPGHLQTEEYAMETFRLFGKSEDEATEETAARMERQQIVFGPGPVHATIVLHESVLYRQVGTPQVMARQMTRLLEASLRPNVIIQLVREGPYFFGLEAPFEIAIGEGITDTMVTVAMEDYVDDRREIVLKAIALFEQIRARAIPVHETRADIEEALRKWESMQ
jgi:transcriptional regulator with XRE-family HTH domain